MGQHPEALGLNWARRAPTRARVELHSARMNRRTRWVLVALTALLPAVIVNGPASTVVHAAAASVGCDPLPAGGAAAAPALESYTAINPQRLVDTRNNIGGWGTTLGAGCTMRVNMAGDIPANAAAVSLSMTAISDTRDYFTVYPCASGRPDTSNLNTRPGIPTPNLVVAIPDVNREICIFSHGTAHVIIDLAGWWSDGPDRFASIQPTRVYDTRQAGGTRLARLVVREVKIPTSVIPDGSTAAVVNLTVDGAAAAGYLTAFPCGQPAPPSSNLNFVAGEARAVAAIVGLGLGNTMCLLTDVSANVIVDVNGYYAPAPRFGPTAQLQPLSGTRIVDTRNGIGGPLAPFQAGETRKIDPVALVPGGAEASSVLLNVIAANARSNGYLSIYPCSAARPEVSSLNYTAPGEATNLVSVELASDRSICIYAYAATDVIVDVFGVMAAPAGSLVERLSFNKAVWPDFTPSGPDYAVVCNAGTTTLNIQLDLLPQVTATLDGAPVTTGAITRQVQTDQLLTLTLTRGAQSMSYYFRCLPADFPTLTVDRPGNPSPGWYLTTFGIAGSPGGPFSVILDNRGAPVWYKRTSVPVLDFKKLSDGTFVYVPQLGAGFGTDPARGYLRTTLTGALVAEVLAVVHPLGDPVEYPTDQHDYVELPGGGRAMFSYPIFTGQDLTPLNSSLAGQCGTFAPATCPFTANETVADGVIQEIDAAGNLVWTWSARDKVPLTDTTFPVRFDIPGHPGTVDLHHLNGLDRINDGTGDYLVTARHLDAAFRIDRNSPTGDIKWFVGGTQALCTAVVHTNCRLSTVGDPYGGPARPHDARLTGNVLTMMDNRTATGQPSRAVAYRIDETNGTATMIWQIVQPTGQNGGTLGSVRIQPDGSIVVGWGAPVQPMFTEYDANRNLTMSITQTPAGYSYRIVKYPATDFDAAQLRATAGGTAAGHP